MTLSNLLSTNSLHSSLSSCVCWLISGSNTRILFSSSKWNPAGPSAIFVSALYVSRYSLRVHYANYHVVSCSMYQHFPTLSVSKTLQLACLIEILLVLNGLNGKLSHMSFFQRKRCPAPLRIQIIPHDNSLPQFHTKCRVRLSLNRFLRVAATYIGSGITAPGSVVVVGKQTNNLRWGRLSCSCPSTNVFSFFIYTVFHIADIDMWWISHKREC